MYSQYKLNTLQIIHKSYFNITNKTISESCNFDLEYCKLIFNIESYIMDQKQHYIKQLNQIITNNNVSLNSYELMHLYLKKKKVHV